MLLRWINLSKKNRAIGIITESAQVYDELLKNTSYLIIAHSGVFNSYRQYEIHFNSSNFMHLTGVDTELSAGLFYSKCIGNKLSKSDFKLKDNGTTMLKLSLLPEMFNLDIYRTIGEFDSSGGYVKIKADVASGHNTGVLALKKINDTNYVPCSLLADHVDNTVIATSKQKILYIYSKKKKEKKYTDIVYEDEDAAEHEIPEEISKSINIIDK